MPKIIAPITNSPKMCIFLLISLFFLQLIYDGKLAQSLLFTYNPKAVDGEICLESSPAENQSCFYHSPHALMMDVSSNLIQIMNCFFSC